MTSSSGRLWELYVTNYMANVRLFVVEDMIVDKKYRKRGIGRALFQTLERQAVAQGCTQVILVTESERTDACGFYESIGFHPSKNKGYKKKL